MVNAVAEVGHKFLAPDIERAQLRMFSVCAAYFMSDGNVNGKGSDPIGFWLHENVRVLPKAPSENACSRARRSHHENWFVYRVLHFRCIVCVPYEREVVASSFVFLFRLFPLE